MKKMNYSLLLAFGIWTLSSCGTSNKSENTSSDSVNATADTSVNTEAAAGAIGTIEFAEPAFDFGQIKEGAEVTHTFTLKNTGNAPLIISEVRASCGCTQPEFSKSPVLPGKTSDIKVTFKSEGQVGKQQKIITIHSNASNGLTTVQLKGEVLAAK
ncbi:MULTISPECIES: DUF1573 domain-containing protein [Sphingobacterium]|uniref:DUF1573 domain-containing protein n=2 Tax=Sphingobacterium TaxID=28453 RepID=A0ABV0BVX5_9SPHI|nr:MULTISPECIES: DUF1573 domain-containing protein [unclassified Sphingobacterium]KKX47253.1 hypothetical protein L950_0227525 [Sphingobacterium sp. IITKGP-BTPF85]MBB2949711.1 hypothetical protein [Sphingobacterium sp. JUb56]MCS3556515.1 hypothetical protein [Sphingobacterium sp. JUb21]NJI74423.1 DUF1573 domain-containing protein [Sphingobacterium sp. B16(2022)]QQD12227.1 DUF1573 domain-containing protein [Sphingobacterium sp. UDSM-2020]